MRWLKLVFLGLVSASKRCFVSAKGREYEFEPLLADFKLDRSEHYEEVEQLKQNYLGDIGKIVIEESENLYQTERNMFICVANTLAQYGVLSEQYKANGLSCLEDFEKRTGEFQRRSRDDIISDQAELQKKIQESDEHMDKDIQGFIRRAGAGDTIVTDEMRFEIEKVEQEQKLKKEQHARMLRMFFAEFSDTLCIDIDNVKRGLDVLEVDNLAQTIAAFASKDLTDLGMDYYIRELSLINQTLEEYSNNGTDVEAHSHQIMDTKRRLVTKWLGKIRYNRAITGVVDNINCATADCYRNLMFEEYNPFHRILDDNSAEIEHLPTVELVVQHILDTRLIDIRDIMTAETTVWARPCGVWPLTDPVVLTINPEQLKDFDEFKKAHQRISKREAGESQKYRDKVEEKNLKYLKELSKEELSYMSCLNQVDQRLINGEIVMEQLQMLYRECFESYDEKDNHLRSHFIEDVQKLKKPFSDKIDDMQEKINRVKEKLDKDAAKLASEYLDELEKERMEILKTREEIAKEHRKLRLKLEKGIVCDIDGLKREFLYDEITVLTDLIKRGSNYAFTMCDIDLHVFDAQFLDQEFQDRRRLKQDFFHARRLGSRLTVRFSSTWGCTKCTKCDLYSDSSSSCGGCCLRRRILIDGSYGQEEVAVCFDSYLTPRVEKLIEVRLGSAMADDVQEVYVNCSTFDIENDEE